MKLTRFALLGIDPWAFVLVGGSWQDMASSFWRHPRHMTSDATLDEDPWISEVRSVRVVRDSKVPLPFGGCDTPGVTVECSPNGAI